MPDECHEVGLDVESADAGESQVAQFLDGRQCCIHPLPGKPPWFPAGGSAPRAVAGWEPHSECETTRATENFVPRR
jgi:hypothetical protein